MGTRRVDRRCILVIDISNDEHELKLTVKPQYYVDFDRYPDILDSFAVCFDMYDDEIKDFVHSVLLDKEYSETLLRKYIFYPETDETISMIKTELNDAIQNLITWAIHDRKEYGFDLSLQNYRIYQKNKEMESIIDSI